jgi:hypothetical protein
MAKKSFIERHLIGEVHLETLDPRVQYACLGYPGGSPTQRIVSWANLSLQDETQAICYKKFTYVVYKFSLLLMCIFLARLSSPI